MIPIIPQDKANHFIYGALIFCVGYLCSFLWFPEPLWASMALVALFGFGKEAADHWSNLKAMKAGVTPTHGVEFMDVIATIGGGVSAAFPLFLSTYVP